MSIDIIFFGLALFVENGGTYRVLLPDGRDTTGLPKSIHPHKVSLWVRDKDQKAIATWQPENSDRTDFAVSDPCEVEVTGMAATDPPGSIQGTLQSLESLGFTLDTNKTPMLSLDIKTGNLSAHCLKDMKTEMNIVRWTLDFDKQAIRFTSKKDSKYIELTDKHRQLIIANVPADGLGTRDDFNLYLKLGTGPLLCPHLQTGNLRDVVLLEPTNVPREDPSAHPKCPKELAVLTPDLACSPGTYP